MGTWDFASLQLALTSTWEPGILTNGENGKTIGLGKNHKNGN
jgi:hypothetical protein